MLPTILKSCPNLKSLVLVLDFDHLDERVKIRFSSVPCCLLSSLELVEIKKFNGGPAKMEVAKYFVENSVILEKLLVRVSCSRYDEGFFVLTDLLALPRRSSSCRIVVC